MRLLKIAAIVIVAGVLLLAIGLPFLLDANRFKPELESELSKVLVRDVKVGDLNLSILSGSVAAADLAISEDPGFGSTPFLRAKSLSVGVELMPLILSRRLNVTGITIDAPEIALLQSPAGIWNFSTLGSTGGSKTGGKPAASPPVATASSGASPLELSVKSVKITNGRLTLGRTGSSGRKPLILESVAVSVQDFASATQFPFSVSAKVAGGGDIKLDGNAGPIHASDASMTPFNVTLKINGLDLAGSGLNSMAPDVAGLLALDGTSASDGTTVRVKGRLKAERLKLMKTGTASHTPVELDFENEHRLRKNSGVIRSAVVHIGKSQAALTGTYAEHPDSTDLKLNLTGSNMAATDLASLLPAFGVALPAGSSIQGGTLNVKLQSEGPADKLVTTGNLALADVRLAGFDLGKNMVTVEKLAGIKTSPDMDIQTAATNVRIAPDGIATQDIELVVKGFGGITGQGTISPSDLLNFKMNATVQASGLASTLGNLSVPFVVEGSSSKPVFKPDVNAITNAQLKKVESKASTILNGLLGGKKKP
jgi:AsmA protein